MNYPTASYILSTYHNNSFSALAVTGLFPSLEAVGAHVDKTKSSVNPFSPEAKVPLPKEIEDLGYGTSVWKRNRRERDRVRCVNEGYETLRNALPLAENEKRISKVDTLRLAIFYIKHLDRLLKNENHENTCTCFDKFVAESNEQILRGKLHRTKKFISN
uniref:BHLH domain-containing protein n=1 Tax=Steinernema glaseri TaxID=37863 RepID=A0A1I7ZLX2_9BILA